MWTATFGEPVHKTLVATLTFLRVVYEGGLELGPVIDGVRSAISDSFQHPDPSHPEIPAGSVFVADVPTGAVDRTGAIDVLDVLVNAQGGLQILVSPLPPPGAAHDDSVSWAAVRQFQVQQVLDLLVEG